jgi:hypothetical protein
LKASLETNFKNINFDSLIKDWAKINHPSIWKDQNTIVHSQAGHNYWSVATVEPLSFMPKLQHHRSGRWKHLITLPSIQLQDVYNSILWLTLKQTNHPFCPVLIKQSTSQFFIFLNIHKCCSQFQPYFMVYQCSQYFTCKPELKSQQHSKSFIQYHRSDEGKSGWKDDTDHEKGKAEWDDDTQMPQTKTLFGCWLVAIAFVGWISLYI